MNVFKRPGLLRNLQIGFGLSLLILIIVSVASYSSIQNLLSGSQWVDHTDSVLIELGKTLSTLQDAETGQRGYLLTGDTSFLEPYSGALERAQATADRVQDMTIDNPVQQRNAAELQDVLVKRFSIIQSVIDQKKADNIFSVEDLKKGKVYMDQARRIIGRMQAEEHRLLVIRLARVRKYAGYTPTLIIIGAILSVIIFLIFYRRVHKDYLERAGLYTELQSKDEEIQTRIDIIRGIADKISAGQYQTRVTDEEKDGLGSLSGSLNKMAESLEYSFGLLSDKEWLQAGIATLNEVMVGEGDIRTLSSKIIGHVSQYTHSLVGALYIADAAGSLLNLGGGYGLAPGNRKEVVKTGEGLAGQCMTDHRRILVNNIQQGEWVISFVSGEVRPGTMIAVPFFHEKKFKGVIEMGSLEPYTERELEFLNSITENIGIAINSMQNRAKLLELLEETQAQTEELQSQHSEMEALNSELEVQAEKLQVSEEELKVQQEELQQTNTELEEKSRSLEEKNYLVLVRNLEIQKKAEDLALSAKYKSEFMANMSHELRTPLNSILLLSRLLAENNEQGLAPEQVEYARVIQNSGHGLLQLIDEILDLSKIESGKLELEHAVVTVEEIMEDMRMLFAPLAKDKNLELKFIIEPGAPVQLETDRMRLEQILKNLLSNALKFTPEGEIELRVSPSPVHKGFIDFSVKDSGIGIPKDKHESIFEAFQQADGSTRRKYGGTGLGLSISLQLVKLLGGEIRLTSEPDAGSEFQVSIPPFKTTVANWAEPLYAQGAGGLAGFSPADVLAASGVGGGLGSDHAGALAGQGSPQDGQQSLQQGSQHDSNVYTLTDIPPEMPDDRLGLGPADKVLLIVEDDPNFARALLEFARKKGYKGVIAVRGDAAIALAKTYKPQGILLDLQLPVKSGWKVMDDLKKDPQTRHIPVHIMSSFEMKKESLLKGAIDFVTKSEAFENMDAIFFKIESVLNNSPKKVLIIEDNSKHARALAYFLGNHHLRTEIANTINGSREALQKKELDCVILDIGINDIEAYETLHVIKQDPALENIPIIVFTGNSISKGEELRLKQYADSIVVKTAHSYQRVLDEVSLFLHLVDEGREGMQGNGYRKFNSTDEMLRNKTALIADDDVRNIFSLTKTLETHKMKVISAMDGKEALAAIEAAREPVDIILMDMMMPEMDGYETIERIRKNTRLKGIPIIAVTAKAMAGDREKCIRAGASDYITKPVDMDQLISLLRIWLYEK
jgi:signal transduction histidine kinase/DNA-binding response OmpR family regulator/CHASE3 domain sensor protein